MVIATSQATARRHIIADAMRQIDADIVVEAAGGIAVADFVNAGGKIETAGVFVDPEPPKDGTERARELLGGGQEPGEQ
jgi:hypothetical protein